jgi:large subunit ribosomal protein L18
MSSVNEGFLRRAKRVRHTLKRTAHGRARLSVFRSSKHIYAQVIDDAGGKTVAAASTLDKDLKGALKKGSDLAAAQSVGKLVAERAINAGVKDVVFDRGGYLYHGRVKALADAAREAGLNF